MLKKITFVGVLAVKNIKIDIINKLSGKVKWLIYQIIKKFQILLLK